MLKIRMSRIGKKNQPYYRITIAEDSRDTFGKSLEILGSWDPRTKELNAKPERIKHWLSNGAQMSDTVNNLLVEKGMIEGKKIISNKTSQKKKDKPKK